MSLSPRRLRVAKLVETGLDVSPEDALRFVEEHRGEWTDLFLGSTRRVFVLFQPEEDSEGVRRQNHEQTESRLQRSNHCFCSFRLLSAY